LIDQPAKQVEFPFRTSLVENSRDGSCNHRSSQSPVIEAKNDYSPSFNHSHEHDHHNGHESLLIQCISSSRKLLKRNQTQDELAGFQRQVKQADHV